MEIRNVVVQMETKELIPKIDKIIRRLKKLPKSDGFQQPTEQERVVAETIYDLEGLRSDIGTLLLLEKAK